MQQNLVKADDQNGYKGVGRFFYSIPWKFFSYFLFVVSAVGCFLSFFAWAIDSYYHDEIRQIVNHTYLQDYEIFVLFIICGVVGIIIFAQFMIIAGRSASDGDVHLNFFDRIPLELYWVV